MAQKDNPLFAPPKVVINQKMSSQKSMENDDNEESKESSSNNYCVEDLLEAQLSLRMQHWLTKSFAQHKALGKAYDGLDDLIDTFVETLIGAKGRGVLSGITSVSVGGDPIEILNDLESTLRNDIPKDVGEKETALLNIRDEMLGLVQHTKYLLTLE
jgi:hypothetical protein